MMMRFLGRRSWRPLRRPKDVRNQLDEAFKRLAVAQRRAGVRTVISNMTDLGLSEVRVSPPGGGALFHYATVGRDGVVTRLTALPLEVPKEDKPWYE